MPRLAQCFSVFLAAGLSLARAAAAQPAQAPENAGRHLEPSSASPGVPSTEAPVPPVPTRIISLTFSPLHLQYPVVELMAEVRLFAKNGRAVSAAFIAGYGKLSQVVEMQSGLQKDTLHPKSTTLGGQLLYYPLGDFRSLHIGGEVMIVKYLGLELEKGQNITTLGDGVAVGPFLGYKYLDNTGFTASAQLGIDYMVRRLHEPAAGTKLSSGTPSHWFPIINVNVGWSF
jgi:hypothetical protein